MDIISVYSVAEPELKETSTSLSSKIDEDKRVLRISKDLIPGVINDNKNIFYMNLELNKTANTLKQNMARALLVSLDQMIEMYKYSS